MSILNVLAFKLSTVTTDTLVLVICLVDALLR